jgi:hypothetical protein
MKNPPIKNTPAEKTIRVKITEPMHLILRQLVRSGFWGLTPEDAARRLIERKIIDDRKNLPISQ